MEELAADILRGILIELPLASVILLSATSVRENDNVFQAINVFTSSGKRWWEDKLQRDFGRFPKVPGLRPNEMYFLNMAPLVQLVEYGVTQGVEEMLLEAKRSIPSEDDLRALISSEDPRVRDFVEQFDASPRLFIKIGRTDLALKQADKMLSEYPSRYWNEVSGYLKSYGVTGDKGYAAIAERIMSHPEYYKAGVETLKSLIASDASAEAVEIALSGMKSVGGKKVGINDGGGAALMNAVKRRKRDIVRLLLDAGANPSIARGKAFSAAVGNLDYKTMKMLSDQPDFGNAHLRRRDLPQQGEERELIDLLVLSGKVILD